MSHQGGVKNKVRFVKEGGKLAASAIGKREVDSILDGATDWVLMEDLGKQLHFPSFICETLLRPDIVLFSKDLRTVIIIELTCPCEENFDYWHFFKLTKYQELKKLCELAGWKVVLMAVEVGARGFASSSLKSCFQKMGIVGKQVRIALDQAATAAIRASFWIWLKRKETPVELPDAKKDTAKFASINRKRKRASTLQEPKEKSERTSETEKEEEPPEKRAATKHKPRTRKTANVKMKLPSKFDRKKGPSRCCPWSSSS